MNQGTSPRTAFGFGKRLALFFALFATVSVVMLAMSAPADSQSGAAVFVETIVLGDDTQQVDYELSTRNGGTDLDFSQVNGESESIAISTARNVVLVASGPDGPGWTEPHIDCTGITVISSVGGLVYFDITDDGQQAACTIAYAATDQPVSDNWAMLTISGETPPADMYYDFVAVETPREETLSLDGESVAFLIAPDDFAEAAIVARYPGWSIEVQCEGPDGVVSAGPAAVELDMGLPLQAGFETVCTMTSTYVDTARLRIVFDISGYPTATYALLPFHRYLQNPNSLALTQAITANAELGLELDKPWYLDFEGTCSGDNGALNVHENGISGQLPVGAAVTCVYTAEVVASAVPMTLNVENDAPQSYSRMIYRSGPNSDRRTDAFTMRSGESYTMWIQPGARFDFATLVDRERWSENLRCDATADNDVDAWLSEGETLFLRPGWLSELVPADVEPFTCTFSFGPPWTGSVVVSCLAGNGRVDVNVLNETDEPVTYMTTVGSLSPRTWTVAAGDWGRGSVSGRPDGELRVRVWVNDVPVHSEVRNVACDSAAPEVTAPEVQVLNACRNGDGFVAWLFANPTNAKRSYVIEFVDLPNRSTTAQAHGQTVRGVSGRPDGTYSYKVRIGGTVIEESSATVDCD